MDDQTKFDGLHGHYLPYVEAFVRRRCDAGAVDDVVAEVFTTAWVRLHRARKRLRTAMNENSSDRSTNDG